MFFKVDKYHLLALFLFLQGLMTYYFLLLIKKINCYYSNLCLIDSLYIVSNKFNPIILLLY